MRYREFTKTDYYKTSEALNIIFDHLSLVLALSLIIGFPLTGALIEGFVGFFVGLGIIILTFGILPGIFSLLFLLNFLISSNPVTETYFFEFGAQRSRTGTEETTYITLENNTYDKYVGLRIFINYEEMKDAVTITYTFEEGLLGLRVMKDYKFNETEKFFNVQY